MNTSPRPTPPPGVVPWSNAVAYKAPPGPMSNLPVAVFGGVVLWFKLYSTASVHTPPAIAGGANSKTVPPKPAPNASLLPPSRVVPQSAPLSPKTRLAPGAAPSGPLKLWSTVLVQAAPLAGANSKTVPHRYWVEAEPSQVFGPPRLVVP